MTLDVDIRPKAGYILAVMSGPFHARPAQEGYVQAMRAAAERELPLLVDLRGIVGGPTHSERLAFGMYAAAEHNSILREKNGWAPRVAVIGRPPLVEPHRFGETVAVNRGARIKVTERLEEALEWLGLPR